MDGGEWQAGSCPEEGGKVGWGVEWLVWFYEQLDPGANERGGRRSEGGQRGDGKEERMDRLTWGREKKRGKKKREEKREQRKKDV